MKIKSICIAAVSFTFCVMAHAQTTITSWTFDNLPKTVNPNPAPTTGSGTAIAIGMDNSYPTPGTSTNASDVQKQAGSSDPSSQLDWRIRGAGNTGTAGNGWSTNAPIGTQGAQFNVSTLGYTNISVSFDTYISTKGEAKMAVEYTTDGSTWSLLTPVLQSGSPATIQNNSSSANTIVGDFIQINTGSGNNWLNGITLDFSGISAANNDANFGIRLVNAATGADNIAASGNPLDNASGNWQFDNVIFSGTPVPEPSTLALASAGLLTLWGLSRRK